MPVAHHYQFAPIPELEKYVLVAFDYEPRSGPEAWNWNEDGTKAKYLTTGNFGQRSVQEILNPMIQRNHQNYIYVSFLNLRSDDVKAQEAYKSYMKTILTNGIKYGDQTYMFCGLNHSQLRMKSCFMYAASNHLSVTRMLNSYGDFEKIGLSDVANLSRKIGHLYTTAEQIVYLGENQFVEIDDIEHNGQIFTDGFGFISPDFANEIANKYNDNSKVFNSMYIPQVLQIIYKGYKGTLVVQKEDEMKKILKPETVMAKQKQSILMNLYLWMLSYFCCLRDNKEDDKIKVIFRKSMKKFDNGSLDDFCILKRSKPTKAAKLDLEIISLLSSLGIKDEVFQRKLDEYLMFIRNANKTRQGALDFMRYKGNYRILRQIRNQDPELNNIPPRIHELLLAAQADELNSWYSKQKVKSGKGFIMIPKSRFLYGVCDISGKLKKGECYVRYTTDKKSLATAELNKCQVLVARTPRLHPGDIQVFKAVKGIPELEHLVDCIVFSTASPGIGKLPPTSKMSGEDFNGDKLFVCWDPDLIPEICVEPLDYDKIESKTGIPFKNQNPQLDLIDYFVNYDIEKLDKIGTLYKNWIRVKPDGAFSQECQKLNILYCKCVNGENVEIPPDLLNPPKVGPKPFILDILTDQIKNNLRLLDLSAYILKYAGNPEEDQDKGKIPSQSPKQTRAQNQSRSPKLQQSPRTAQNRSQKFRPGRKSFPTKRYGLQPGQYLNYFPESRAPAQGLYNYNRDGYGYYNEADQDYQYAYHNNNYYY